MSTLTARPATFSFVTDASPATPAEAQRHFAAKLAVETDPWDVNADLERGGERILVVDARGTEPFAECHVAGAINLPHRTISTETTASLPRDRVLVVYCWGPACNAASKAALRLAALGFQVKEMVGGLEYWRREGFGVDGTLGGAAPLYG
jgi:rhodanese-related sulfurtransferase